MAEGNSVGLPPLCAKDFVRVQNSSGAPVGKKTATNVSLVVDGDDLPIQQYEGNYTALE